MLDQLKKAIRLVKKTGDKIVFFDSQSPDDTVVLVDFEAYEKLISGDKISDNQPKSKNLTDEDLTDKINREILMWKNQENSEFLEEESRPRPSWKIPPDIKSGAKKIE
ncbi:MAG: hypothetical protein WC441_02485 [Patescibacteria group bacterium]